MPDPKQQLVELIEAYAVAKATGNSFLQQLATQQLSAFFEQIDVTRVKEEEPDQGAS